MKGKKVYSFILMLSLIFLLSGCSDNGGQSGTLISEEEAKSIALERVTGATKDDIREFKIDRRNGLLEYEGKIFYNGKEYEFEIDGSDGAVLEWEIEDI